MAKILPFPSKVPHCIEPPHGTPTGDVSGELGADTLALAEALLKQLEDEGHYPPAVPPAHSQ